MFFVVCRQHELSLSFSTRNESVAIYASTDLDGLPVSICFAKPKACSRTIVSLRLLCVMLCSSQTDRLDSRRR